MRRLLLGTALAALALPAGIRPPRNVPWRWNFLIIYARGRTGSASWYG